MDEAGHVDQFDRDSGPDRGVTAIRPGAEQNQHRSHPLAAGLERRTRVLGKRAPAIDRDGESVLDFLQALGQPCLLYTSPSPRDS